MTELQQLESMLRRVGVIFDITHDDSKPEIIISYEGLGGDHPTNTGRFGAAWFVFSNDGLLLRVGASDS